MTVEHVPDRALEVPPSVRNQVVHGYVQLVADAVGVDLLHIKGAAVHDDLQEGERLSLDVDVLVRPSHVERLIEALYERGWKRVTGFEEGSAFGHAMNLRHDLGLIDLHRRWPGFEITADSAFDGLWSRRSSKKIAHVSCAVPSLNDQRLVLLLHFARSGGARRDDLHASWTRVSDAERHDLKELAAEFDSSLALSAATGDIDLHRDDRGYLLWRYFLNGDGGRMQEWQGRFFAARGWRGRLHVLRSFLMVNRDLLAFELGRPPSSWDLFEAYVERCVTALKDVEDLLRRRGRRRP